MNKSSSHGFWYGFNLTAVALVVLFLIGLPLLVAFAQFVRGVDISAVQHAPADVLVPASFTIEIANEQHTPLNAVEFELSYDPEALLITSIIPHTTLCEEQFIIANTINNASGTALFQCGTVTPFAEATGTIATVHALPLRSGTTSVNFAELTHVLMHDGLGTDATHMRSDLLFTIR